MPLRRVTVGDTESLVELNDVTTGPANTLAGRIVLTDGKELPRQIQLLLSAKGRGTRSG